MLEADERQLKVLEEIYIFSSKLFIEFEVIFVDFCDILVNILNLLIFWQN